MHFWQLRGEIFVYARRQGNRAFLFSEAFKIPAVDILNASLKNISEK